MKIIDKRGPHEDRRIDDVGPPDGWRDRRKRVERRIPETNEVEVSDAEWAEYFANPSKKATEHEHAAAADVLGRLRN
jgi:glycogen debranching enzyme